MLMSSVLTGFMYSCLYPSAISVTNGIIFITHLQYFFSQKKKTKQNKTGVTYGYTLHASVLNLGHTALSFPKYDYVRYRVPEGLNPSQKRCQNLI
jgi:hypothetical protein